MQCIIKHKKNIRANLRLFLILFFIKSGLNCPAQNSSYQISDTTVVYALIDSCKKYQRIDKEIANDFIHQGIELADNIGEPQARIRVRLQLSTLNISKFKPVSEKVLWESVAIAESENLPYLKAATYNNLGINYRHKGQLDSALYCHKESLFWAQENENKELLWKSKLSLFKVYNANNQLEEAEKNLLGLWELAKGGNRIQKGVSLYHLASFNFEQNRLGEYAKWQDEWQKYVLAGKKSIDKIIDPQHYQLSLFFEDLPKTIAKFDTILAYHQARKDTARIGTTYWELAKTYEKQGKFQEALKIFAIAQPMIEKAMGHVYLVLFYKNQYEVAKKAKDDSSALSSFENLQNLLRRVRKTEMDQRIAELEIKYETTEKENKIAKTTLQRNWILATLALFTVLAGIVIWFLRNQLKINRKIAEQGTELQNQRIFQLEQDKKLLAYTAMIDGQEQERARIARELHDGLGGLLATVKAHFNELRTPDKQEIFQKTNQLLDTACTEVREIAHNMMPHSLMLSGLAGAIEGLATSLEAQDISCDLELVGWKDDLLHNPQQVMLYRIVQELVNNIRKHAEAKQVLIQLLRYDGELTLIIEDDGKGFYKNKTADGLGLKNIHSRVQLLKGKIDIDSVPNEGTTVTIRVPLKSEKIIAS